MSAECFPFPRDGKGGASQFRLYLGNSLDGPSDGDAGIVIEAQNCVISANRRRVLNRLVFSSPLARTGPATDPARQIPDPGSDPIRKRRINSGENDGRCPFGVRPRFAATGGVRVNSSRENGVFSLVRDSSSLDLPTLEFFGGLL